MQLCYETQGGTRNRTRDLPKRGSAFITSSDHWTKIACGPGSPELSKSYMDMASKLFTYLHIYTSRPSVHTVKSPLHVCLPHTEALRCSRQHDRSCIELALACTCHSVTHSRQFDSVPI